MLLDGCIRLTDDGMIVGYRRSSAWNPDQHLYFAIQSNVPFMRVVVSDDSSQAWVQLPTAKQVELEDDTVPYKVKSVNYFNNVQSLLMVSLVTKYFAQTAAGEARVWIEGDEMRETMRRLFEDDPDIITSENTMRAAIGAMVRNGYLREVAQDRYEVMPIVGVVYTLDEIRAVLERYGLEEVDSDLAKRREGDNRE